MKNRRAIVIILERDEESRLMEFLEAVRATRDEIQSSMEYNGVPAAVGYFEVSDPLLLEPGDVGMTLQAYAKRNSNSRRSPWNPT